MAATAPIELIHDKPYVEVMVNGRGPYRFLVDTGTGTQALISPELVHELGIPTVGHARLTDPSGQGEQRSDMVWVESLKIGGVEFEEVQAVEHRLFREEQNCQGVLGFPLFEDYLLTLDYPGRKMVLSAGTLPKSAAGSVLPFQMKDGVPIARLQIDGLGVDAQVDTGGNGLSLPDAVAVQIRFQTTPVEYGTAESLATRFSLRAARLQPDVWFGPYVFRRAFVEINSAFPLVNIGSTPLKNFVITFDQAEGVMLLYSKDRVMRLDASPVLVEMQNEPRHQASDAKLVPVG
ncbi:pepsin/retropepsin-like aspartic protease family protein [Occallatibacter savannae]|uniref:pepsin/retropepsin-like aspartic protease family protein n=1 Tax=Occallatibacter savannae TaxID=1002691 RepID=UPI000D68B4F1|nr:pepsin/retropepsin-like aspartic protease family protein [Occallatibacter savannae]